MSPAQPSTRSACGPTNAVTTVFDDSPAFAVPGYTMLVGARCCAAGHFPPPRRRHWRPARACCPRRVYERHRNSTGRRRRRRPRRCGPRTRTPAVAGFAGLTGSSAANPEHRTTAERSCHGGNQEGCGQPGEARPGRSPSCRQVNAATAIEATAAGVGSRAGRYPRTCCTGHAKVQGTASLRT